MANALRGYLNGRPSNSPVWGGTWAKDHRGAEMIRIDLEAAGIAYAVEGPDGPEYADFHALRHSFLTLGGRSGIDLRTLQELAGHSKPELTARYSHRRLFDLAGAVDMLPNLVPADLPTANPTAAEIPLRMTGTEGMKSDNLVRFGVPPGVPTGYAEPHQSASGSILGIVGGFEDQFPKSTQSPVKQASRRSLAPACIDSHQRGRPDLNRQPPERQSGTPSDSNPH